MGSRLADALVEGGLVTRQAVALAEARRRDHGGRLGSALVALGLVDAERLALIEREVAVRHLVLPLAIRKDVVVRAMADPTDLIARDAVFLTRCWPGSRAC